MHGIDKMVQFANMLFSWFLVLFFVNYVVCQSDCVTYEFEDDFRQNFTSNACQGSWKQKTYLEVGFDSNTLFNDRSTAFITPSSDMSCTTSFIFPMHKDGVLTLNVYYDASLSTDVLRVIVYQKETAVSDKIVGIDEIKDNANQDNWISLQIKLAGPETYSGYFTIFGRKSSNSFIYVDSFKYESPDLVNICKLYETTTTTENYITTTPTENEIPTTPTENDIMAVPTKNDITTTTTENDIPTTPTNNDIPTTTTENNIPTTPTENDITTIITDNDNTDTPTENDITTTTMNNDTTITTTKSDITTTNTDNFMTTTTTENDITTMTTESDVTTITTENEVTTTPTVNDIRTTTTENELTTTTTDNDVTNTPTENDITTTNTDSYMTTTTTENDITTTTIESDVTTTTTENDTTIITTENDITTTPPVNDITTTTTENEPTTTTKDNDITTATIESDITTTTTDEKTTTTTENEISTKTTENDITTTTTENNIMTTTTENDIEITTNENESENNSSSCVTNNFEENFDSFGATGICSKLRTDSFDRRRYATLGIASPHILSTFYITPMQRISCIASSPFTMHANGVLEIHVFLQPSSLSDQLTVMVYKKVSPTQDQIVGSFATDPRRHIGWNKYNITVTGDESYEGYVAFMGTASIKSIALIDSFRYIPPTVDGSSCVVYEETSDVTSTTDTSVFPSTPELGEVEEENGCVVYRFGQDFNNLFTRDGICRFSNIWELRSYSILKINSPHPDSFSCIVPSRGSSCTSSFIFPVTATGILEVKVYMEPMTLSEQVEVIVHQVNDDGSILIVGSGETGRYFGWTTIKIHLAGNGDYNGRVTIFGRTSARSFFVVDSFRYIPPSVDEQKCLFYSEETN